MNREDIIRMARAAGCKPFRSPEHWDDVQVFATPDVLERFAALVSKHEREECAKVCDGMDHNGVMIAADCAAAIRARGDE